MPPEGMEIPSEYLADMEDTRRRLRKMAGSGGLEIVFSGKIPNSRTALEATEYACAKGRGDEFHKAVFDRLYCEGRDIGNWEVLGDAALAAGLDPDEMKRSVRRGDYSAVLDEKLEEAAARGIKAVPTFIINGRYRIVGAQTWDVFEQAIAEAESGD